MARNLASGSAPGGWRLPELFYDVCGIVGVMFYIGSYGALQFGILRGSSLAYTMGNLAASSLVFVSLLHDWNQASAIVNGIWISISLVGLFRIYVSYRGLSFNAEEALMLAAVLSEMPKPQARAFLDAGDWTDLPANHVLTREGEPVETLYYLSEGRALVRSGGHLVGQVEQGFVGEMNVLAGRPATATVYAEGPSRVFAVSGTRLRQLYRRDGDFMRTIDAVLSRDTGRKLEAANARLRGPPPVN